jgi:predicted transcriptional regulator
MENIEKQLEKVGFTALEARVYLDLLKLGKCTIGVLTKELSLFRQSIYNILKKLNSKGFIKTIQNGGRKYFLATDPEVILDYVNNQRRLTERLLPDLHAVRGTKKYISEIKTYRGVQAFQIFHEKMLKLSPPASTVSVLGAGGDEFLKIMRQGIFFTRYDNLRLDKKISHNLLMYENQRNVSSDYTTRRHVNTKFLSETFMQPIATQIWPDRVAIILFGETPEVIEIKSKRIMDGFKNYFDILWGIAKN